MEPERREIDLGRMLDRAQRSYFKEKQDKTQGRDD
jgi:hypothetical protein